MVIRVKHVITLIILLGIFFNYGASFHSVLAKSSKRDYNRSRHEYQEYIEKKSLTDGYYKYRRDYKWGLCDSYNFITPARYDDIKYLNKNYFAVEIAGSWGVIDSYGHLVLPLEWDYITHSNDEFYLVQKNSRYGLIDIFGNIKLPLKWSQLYHLSNGNYAAKKDSYYGVIDITEKVIMPMEWENIRWLYDTVYKVEKNNLYGCFSSDGKKILNVDNSYLERILGSPFISVCNTKTGCGILNKNMKVVIPLTYNGIFDDADCDNGYFSFSQSGKKGLYDITGKQLSSVNYDVFMYIDHNIAFTRLDGLYGLTSTREKREIVPPIYKKIEKMDQKGYYKVKHDGKWGVVGYDGKFVLPCNNGPFEVNRKIKKLTTLNQFNGIDSYNYQEGLYLLANKYLLADVQKEGEIVLYKLISSENPYNDIRAKAKELARNFNIEI